MRVRISSHRLPLLLICGLLLLGLRPAEATTFYVDSSRGNDSAQGNSQEQAWKTLGRLSEGRFQPGDQVLLSRNSTWNEQLTVPSSGAEGAPLKIGAYGTGQPPLIDAQFARNRGISVVGKAYVEISDIAVQNSASISIEIFNSSHITVRNCHIRNSKKTAISVGGLSPGVEIDGCTYAHDPDFKIDGSFVGVLSPVEGVVVSNNKVENFNGRIAIALFDVNNAEAFGNVIDGGGIGVAINACSRSLTGGQIHDNLVSNISTVDGDGEAIEIVGHVGAINPHCEQQKANPFPVLTASAEVYGNKVQGGPNTFGGIDGWHAVQCRVHDNQIIGTQKYGMQWTAESTDNEFFHNQISTAGVAGIAIYGNGGKSSANIHNNTLDAMPMGISADASAQITEDYNVMTRVKQMRSSSVAAGAHTKNAN